MINGKPYYFLKTILNKNDVKKTKIDNIRDGNEVRISEYTNSDGDKIYRFYISKPH
jgi:hypothetical protein